MKHSGFPEEFKTDPSWGWASFSSVSGGSGKFFATPVQSQHHIRLRIGQAKRGFSFGHQVVYPEGVEHIEISFSPAQFAELLTTMNAGSGVPCTIDRLMGKKIEFYEDTTNEMLEVKHIARKQFEEAAKEYFEAQQEILNILSDKKNLTKEDRAKIKNILDRMGNEVKHNMPFYVDMFNEAAERLTTVAKSEIASYFAHVSSVNKLEGADDATDTRIP
jgi:hypothetical protein